MPEKKTESLQPQNGRIMVRTWLVASVAAPAIRLGFEESAALFEESCLLCRVE
jgi:hypothetical protein